MGDSLRRLAAVLLLIGLVTPYSCDVRPITTLWGEWVGVLVAGIPVLCLLIYALQALVRLVAAFMLARRRIFQPLFLAVLLLVTVVWITGQIQEDTQYAPVLAVLAGSLLWSGTLFALTLRRGRRANPFPLLLLATAAIPVINYFYWEYDRLKYGAWILTAGYALAVFEEMRERRPHGEPARVHYSLPD